MTFRDTWEPEIEAGAEAIDDLLTMLGVDPKERSENDHRTTAEILAEAVLKGATAANLPQIRHDESGLIYYDTPVDPEKVRAEFKHVPGGRHA